MKKSIVISLGILFGLANLVTASAAQPQWSMAMGRLIAPGSGYYSVVDGEFILDYYDESLPWGSEVLLRYGFTKAEFRDGTPSDISDWNESEVKAMKPIGPFKWGIKLNKQLYSRGASVQLSALDYVFEIRLPDGRTGYDRGSDSLLGFYKASVPKEGNACYPWGEQYCTLNVQRMVR